MQKEYLIAVNEFCANHHIENSFIISLEKTGLIEIKTIKEEVYIDAEQLQQLEKIVHFYYELDINLEGIETINHLLHRIKSLHDENTVLRNRLLIYESDD
jgi:hypothetical protein